MLTQNIPNLEYIIIDGGSTDGSIDIIRKYGHKLSYWISEKDKGQSDAINKGLGKSHGEIISWLNSDDQLMPDTLRHIASLFEKHPDIAVIHGKTQLFGAIKKPVIQGAAADDLEERYLSAIPFPQPSSFFTRAAFEKVGFLNESLHFGMDYDFYVRMALQFNFLSIEDVLSKYLLHAQSKSVRSSAAFAREWSWVFSKVLRSLPYTGNIINDMQLLSLYREGNDTYTVMKSYSQESIRKAFYYHLYYLVVFLYQAIEKGKVQEITHYIYKTNPDFLRAQKLSNIYWKTKLLPHRFISLGRKFTR